MIVSITTRDVDRLCLILQQGLPGGLERFQAVLTAAQVSASVQAQLIQCLRDAGITFTT
jgi:hypothetical protein